MLSFEEEIYDAVLTPRDGAQLRWLVEQLEEMELPYLRFGAHVVTRLEGARRLSQICPSELPFRPLSLAPDAEVPARRVRAPSQAELSLGGGARSVERREPARRRRRTRKPDPPTRELPFPPSRPAPQAARADSASTSSATLVPLSLGLRAREREREREEPRRRPRRRGPRSNARLRLVHSQPELPLGSAPEEQERAFSRAGGDDVSES